MENVCPQNQPKLSNNNKIMKVCGSDTNNFHSENDVTEIILKNCTNTIETLEQHNTIDPNSSSIDNDDDNNDELKSSQTKNLRLKFRKSHTCGSLFANCNCDSDFSILSKATAPPIPATLTSADTTIIQHKKIPESRANSLPLHALDGITINTVTAAAAKTNISTASSNNHHHHNNSIILNKSSYSNFSDSNQICLEQNNREQFKNGARADNFVNNSNISGGETITEGNSTSFNQKKKRNKKLFQSYSHPDTQFIFTDENCNPSSKDSSDPGTIFTKSGHIAIKHPKRSSSPNIGHYTVLDIHPEILLKIHSNQDINRCVEAGIVTKNRKKFSNDNITKEKFEECRNTEEQQNRNKCLLRQQTFDNNKENSDFHADDISPKLSLPNYFREQKNLTSSLKNQHQILSAAIKSKAINSKNKTLDSAQKYFAESGILGPNIKTNTVKLIRKTSKIMQESNFVGQVRKNSKILLCNSTNKLPKASEMNGSIDLSDEMDDIDLKEITNEEQPELCNCENRIKSLVDELVSLKDIVNCRDSEIHKLKREIHKLKSVLQQTSANRIPLTTLQNNHGPASQKSLNSSSILDNDPNKTGSTNESNSSEEYSYAGLVGFPCTKLTNSIEKKIPKPRCTSERLVNDSEENNCAPCTSKKPSHCHLLGPVVKKQGVSGESSDAAAIHQSQNVPIPKFDKDFRSKQLIKDAIMDNDFLKNIDSSQVRELVESMYNLDVAKGEFVIREGEAGSHLYVSAEGNFQVIKNSTILGTMGPGKAFGELAILYNCTRTASIRVLSDGARVWVLDRRVFQQIMMRTGMQRIEENINFLKSVPLLKNLSSDILAKIADVLEVEFYPAGTYIIRQGASGDTFFLISQGTVKVTQKLGNCQEEKEIRTLQRGDYFGEQALINEDKRTANIIAMTPGVECLTLDRESFSHLIGNLCELKEKNYGDENRILAMKFSEEKSIVFGANVKQEFPELKLTDLEVVATLGIGGFGRVELVKCYRENCVETYALKCLKKKHIIDTRQEEHVFSERTIMLTCNSPFICRLYRTFRDDKFIYMLLEACMGGEVWTMLRDRGCFDEITTQFIIGCVLQAFEYLHSHGIIYRDLKPENLMLDEKGYVKLVDFGFAKHIGSSQKTWTFCGTPEYVAPEIILNKGHDRAVDYWALGILIHELLNGTPPFTANDPMKTYNIILKGIDMIDFPKHMSRSAVMLIKKLCRDVPAERLGYSKGGIQDIKKHKWFQGFDWDGLSNLTLIPPFLRPVSNPLDTSYFDKFPVDTDIPPDETSGWDSDF